jgi:hypothetical protein
MIQLLGTKMFLAKICWNKNYSTSDIFQTATLSTTYGGAVTSVNNECLGCLLRLGSLSTRPFARQRPAHVDRERRLDLDGEKLLDRGAVR